MLTYGQSHPQPACLARQAHITTCEAFKDRREALLGYTDPLIGHTDFHQWHMARGSRELSRPHPRNVPQVFGEPGQLPRCLLDLSNFFLLPGVQFVPFPGHLGAREGVVPAFAQPVLPDDSRKAFPPEYFAAQGHPASQR